MGAVSVALPPGFVLDEPVPPGFVLDGDTPKTSGAVIPSGGYDFPAPKALTPTIDTSKASLWERVVGAGQTGRNLLNALIASPALVPIGVAEEITGKHAPDSVKQRLAPTAHLTPVGQEYTRQAGQFVQEHGPALIGPAGESAALALKASRNVPLPSTSFSPMAERAAQKLMNSALKPTLGQHASGEAKIAVDTLLNYGINPTKGGVEKLRQKIDVLNDKIAEQITGSKAVIQRDAVASTLGDVRNTFKNQVAPADDLAAINRIADEFSQRPSQIPVQEAQALKQGTYRILNRKYGEQGTASTEAQKGLARGLKEEIASSVPEIASLNAEESALIKTLNVTERRALMDLNKNIVGLSWLAHSPATWAAFMADKSALFKSLAARSLHRMAGSPSPTPQRQGGLLSPEVSYLSMDSPEVKGLFGSIIERDK